MKQLAVTTLAFALFFSGSALAQSGAGVQVSDTETGQQVRSELTQHLQQLRSQVAQRMQQLRIQMSQRPQQRPPSVRPSRPARAVPELDGSFGFLALGLTFAVGALVRERRRSH